MSDDDQPAPRVDDFDPTEDSDAQDALAPASALPTELAPASTLSTELAPASVLSAQLASGIAWLKPRKSRPFFGRHPWVLDSAVARVEGQPAPGDVVDLCSEKGKFIARGLYNPASRLRLRLYSWDIGQPLDDAFWGRKLDEAIALREQLGYVKPEGACRLVFSEADGLSGLVVDRYGAYLVVQFNALAMAHRCDALIALLVERLRPRAIIGRTEAGVVKLEGFAPPGDLLWGELPSGPVFIEEHGLRYGIDLATGQKTGFYLDQRDNRSVAASWFRGRRVLDLFCYSGGFSLNAARGGASEILGIDGSERAIALAKENARLNGLSNVHFEAGDAFDALDAFAFERRRFDAIVLDPPKFTRSRQSVDDALRAYHRINRRAVEILEPGGILVTCSCSGSVSREDFLHMLSGVAQQTRRSIQILDQRGASPDHPVSATCLETEYLKCFICRVGR